MKHPILEKKLYLKKRVQRVFMSVLGTKTLKKAWKTPYRVKQSNITKNVSFESLEYAIYVERKRDYQIRIFLVFKSMLVTKAL